MGDTVRFSIKPVDGFAGINSTIKRPVEVAHFSYDDKRKFHPDDSSLRYYYPPQLGVSLSDGFEAFRKLDETDEHLDSLLKTILELEKKEGKTQKADIVTWRGMITKIMTAPFDNFNEFEMNAVVYQGTIFIEEDFSARVARQREEKERIPSNSSTGLPQEVMSYWGYKFETLATLPKKWDNCTREQIENRNQEVVGNYAQYCSVVRTAIAGIDMVLGGEVDAIWDCRPKDKDTPINWIELKTSAVVNPKQARSFERKLLKFWAQSFLLGVPKIIVGFRDEKGMLVALQEFQTHAIPGAVKRGHGTWDGNICINFLAEFLRFLKNTLTEDGLWHISRRPQHSYIEVSRIKDPKAQPFLSEEFLAWRQKALAQSVADMLT